MYVYIYIYIYISIYIYCRTCNLQFLAKLLITIAFNIINFIFNYTYYFSINLSCLLK